MADEVGAKPLDSAEDLSSADWERGERIGRGAQGMVYRGEITGTGAVVAVKQIDTNEINRNELVRAPLQQHCPWFAAHSPLSFSCGRPRYRTRCSSCKSSCISILSVTWVRSTSVTR